MSRFLGYNETLNRVSAASQNESSRREPSRKMEPSPPLVKEDEPEQEKVLNDSLPVNTPEEPKEAAPKEKDNKTEPSAAEESEVKAADKEEEPNFSFTIDENTDFFSDLYDDEEESQQEEESNMISAETLFGSMIDEQEEDEDTADNYIEETEAAADEKASAKASPASEDFQHKTAVYEVVKPKTLGKKKTQDSALSNVEDLFQENEKNSETPVAKLDEEKTPVQEEVPHKEEPAHTVYPFITGKESVLPFLVLKEGMQEIKFRIEEYQVEAFVKITKIDK